MKNFRPDIKALEEKIEDLEGQVVNHEEFLRDWSKMKQADYDNAEAQLRSITLKWNSLKKHKEANLTQDKEHIQVLKDSIVRLKEPT